MGDNNIKVIRFTNSKIEFMVTINTGNNIKVNQQMSCILRSKVKTLFIISFKLIEETRKIILIITKS